MSITRCPFPITRPSIGDSPAANSNTMHNRLVCSDRNLYFGGKACLPSVAKLPYILNQCWNVKLLQDLECPKPMQHIFLWQIALFVNVWAWRRIEGTWKRGWINYIFTYTGVCSSLWLYLGLITTALPSKPFKAKTHKLKLHLTV